jgi:hypothetical protein
MTNESNLTTDSTEEAEPMRILRIATCKSLSQRSDLTYHVGCNDAGAISFRLWKNSGAGMHSQSWVKMTDVSEALSTPEGFTSSAMMPLFESTSRNNAGFTLALILAEGLAERSLDQRGTYCTANPAPFIARVQRLIANGVNLDPDDAPEESPSDIAPVVPKRGRPKAAKANAVST